MASAVAVVGFAPPDDADAGCDDDSDGVVVVVATFFAVRPSSSSSPVPRHRRAVLDLGAKKDVIITFYLGCGRRYFPSKILLAQVFCWRHSSGSLVSIDPALKYLTNIHQVYGVQWASAEMQLALKNSK